MGKKYEDGMASSHKRFRELFRQYRQRAGLSQKVTAAQLGKQQSYIGMLETGDRSPPTSPELLGKLVNEFQLTSVEAQEFLLSAAGVRYVHEGIPSLDTDEVGYEVARIDASRIWIAGPTPLEFEEQANATYESLYKRVCDGKTIFTYWLPSCTQEAFDAFRHRLTADLEKENLAHRANMTIECILAESDHPLPFDVWHYCIYEPTDSSCRTGRQVISSEDGTVSRVTSMSERQTNYLFKWHDPIYAKIKQSNEKSAVINGATFDQHYPIV